MNHLVRQSMFGGAVIVPATCTITSDETEFTDATPFEIQITFDKERDDLVVGDLNDVNGNCTFSSFANSGDDLVYTCDVTPDLTGGDIQISIDADVTAEGNEASNVVTVTDEAPIPLTVLVKGRDSGVYFTDIDDAVDDLSEIGSDYIILKPHPDASNVHGINMFIESLKVSSPNTAKKYVFSFTRTQLIATTGVHGDTASANTFLGLSGGLLTATNYSTVDINIASFGGYRVEHNATNKPFGLKMYRTNVDTMKTYAAASKTTLTGGATSMDVRLEIYVDSGYWNMETFIDDVSKGVQGSTIADTDVVNILPYFHNDVYSADGTSSEKITNISLVEV